MYQPARFARSLVLRSGDPFGAHPARSAAAAILLAVVALASSGCTLIDQRTFDPAAGRKPVPRLPPAPPAAKPLPPLAVVRFGAAPETWQPDLVAIVRQALARKPDALFTVQTVVPDAGGADREAEAMRKAVQEGGTPVAQTIQDAGASGAQINMTATTGPLSAAEIRVTVR